MELNASLIKQQGCFVGSKPIGDSLNKRLSRRLISHYLKLQLALANSDRVTKLSSTLRNLCYRVFHDYVHLSSPSQLYCWRPKVTDRTNKAVIA